VRSIVMSMSVCLFVGLFVCLSNCLSAGIIRKPHGRTSPNFSACCLWPWLGPLPTYRNAVRRGPRWQGPLLTALRYVMYFRFTNDGLFSYHGANGQSQAWRYVYKKFVE